MFVETVFSFQRSTVARLFQASNFIILTGCHFKVNNFFILKILKIIQINLSKMALKILSVHQRDNDILLYRLNLLKSIAFLH